MIIPLIRQHRFPKYILQFHYNTIRQTMCCNWHLLQLIYILFKNFLYDFTFAIHCILYAIPFLVLLKRKNITYRFFDTIIRIPSSIRHPATKIHICQPILYQNWFHSKLGIEFLWNINNIYILGNF